MAGWYRLLDGAHRWSAYKSTGKDTIDAIIQELDGIDSLLYAAKKAIGPLQLTEDEARDTARRAYTRNTGISSEDIGKAIGRARRTVDSYIADLRAVNQMDKDLKIFRMNSLGIPQDRIAKRLGMIQRTIHNHLEKMAALPKLLNADLSRGFTVSQADAGPLIWRTGRIHVLKLKPTHGLIH
ncbi:MAG: ParB N-terminal domain-containing protein [Desulfobacula sp.]|nr:ParB N-terminal domain-containing protein [Desulfobacula sp.]